MVSWSQPICCPDGQTIQLDVEDDHTIAGVKDRIVAQLSVPRDCIQLFAAGQEDPLKDGDTFLSRHIGADTPLFLLQSAAMTVVEGLELWLDARAEETLRLDDEKVLNWKSRDQCPAVRECTPCRSQDGSYIGSPILHQGGGSCSVEFDFDKTMAISPPLTVIQTIISVHKFKDPRSMDKRSCFYIITGTSQGPFHGGEASGAGDEDRATDEAGNFASPLVGYTITSGHGAWEGAEGQPFWEGSIRVNVEDAKPTNETQIWCDELRVATVTMDNAVPVNGTASKVDRIGRDRDCHAFSGFVAELLVFNRLLTEDEIQSSEQYLRGRHGC
jgi:hypothetical protein